MGAPGCCAVCDGAPFERRDTVSLILLLVCTYDPIAALNEFAVEGAHCSMTEVLCSVVVSEFG